MPGGGIGGAGYLNVSSGPRDQYGNVPRQIPAGYTTDPNTGKYIPIAGSATDVLTQRARQQQIEDQARATTFSRTEADRAARDQLRTRLMGMLDRPVETSYSTAGYAAGGGGGGDVGPVPPEIGKIELPDTSAAQ